MQGNGSRMPSPSKERNLPWSSVSLGGGPLRRVGSIGAAIFLFCLLIFQYYASLPPPWVDLKEVYGSPHFTLSEQFDGEGLEFTATMTKSTKHQFGHKRNREKFDFTVHLPDQNYGKIDQMWQCLDNIHVETGRSKKLVFVHTFKTAGSTIRAILQAYAHHCRAGIAIVVSCSTLSLNSMRHGRWMNDRGRRSGKSCTLKRFESRDSTEIEGKYVNTTLLEQHADILAGHVPLGSDAEWKNPQGQHVNVTYFTMFRDSVDKYVSGVLFTNRDARLSVNETVDMIKKRVTDERKYGNFFERYSGYLISPTQMDDFKRNEVSIGRADAANLIMSNLVDNNVIIGVVERMSESLELLQYIVDSNAHMSTMFQYFGLNNKGGETSKRIQLNKSKLSTSSIVAELEQDTEFMKSLREYVKWDEKVYQFALDLHMRQHRWMRQQARQSSDRRQRGGQ